MAITLNTPPTSDILGPLTPARIAQFALAKTACHEAAHLIVAAYWGVAIYACIVRHDLPSLQYPVYDGESRNVRTSSFRSATIGFAGAIGASAVNKTVEEWRGTLPQLRRAIETCGLKYLSLHDVQNAAEHPQRRRAFNTSVRIIDRNFERLQFVAGQLMERGEYRTVVAADGSGVLVPNSMADLEKQDTRRAIKAPEFSSNAPFHIRLAQLWPLKNPSLRFKWYCTYLAAQIRKVRTARHLDFNRDREYEIAKVNLDADIKNGLTYRDAEKVGEWCGENFELISAHP